jgi:DNA-binding CsgD family transcriptional regulator
MIHFPKLLEKINQKKQEVLLYVLQGYDDFEIAEKNCKSYHTVAKRRKQCYQPLGVNSKEELIAEYHYLLKEVNNQGGGWMMKMTNFYPFFTQKLPIC